MKNNETLSALEQANEALQLVWNDPRARFSTVHKGMPLDGIIRNALSFSQAAITKAKESEEVASKKIFQLLYEVESDLTWGKANPELAKRVRDFRNSLSQD